MFSDDFYDVRNTAGYVLYQMEERRKRFFKEQAVRRRPVEMLKEEFSRRISEEAGILPQEERPAAVERIKGEYLSRFAGCGGLPDEDSVS